MDQYLRATRSPWYSYLFALPLLVLYQLTVLVANAGSSRMVVNGADALVHDFLALVGLRGALGWLGSWVALAVVAGIVAYRLDPTHRKGPLRGQYFWMVLAESAGYALVLGTVVAVLTGFILQGVPLQIGGGSLNWPQRLATSLGAGLYEELLFRLLLTGGLIALLRHFGWKDGMAALTAVLASSVLFSLFHYIGPYGEVWRLDSFTFRLVAGLVLAGLYSVRGFAVAAWTHAFYDVFLLLAGKG